MAAPCSEWSLAALWLWDSPPGSNTFLAPLSNELRGKQAPCGPLQAGQLSKPSPGRPDQQINLEAKTTTHYVHRKAAHLLSHAWKCLIEIQETRLELVNQRVAVKLLT